MEGKTDEQCDLWKYQHWGQSFTQRLLGRPGPAEGQDQARRCHCPQLLFFLYALSVRRGAAFSTTLWLSPTLQDFSATPDPLMTHANVYSHLLTQKRPFSHWGLRKSSTGISVRAAWWGRNNPTETWVCCQKTCIGVLVVHTLVGTLPTGPSTTLSAETSPLRRAEVMPYSPSSSRVVLSNMEATRFRWVLSIWTCYWVLVLRHVEVQNTHQPSKMQHEFS